MNGRSDVIALELKPVLVRGAGPRGGTGDTVSADSNTGVDLPAATPNHSNERLHIGGRLRARARNFERRRVSGDTDGLQRLRHPTGAALLWIGTVSIGFSTVVLLALLSHHFHHEAFASLATLFSLFFIASLIPAGIPLRAAALEVDGAPRMRWTSRHAALVAAAGLAASPLVAFVLHLPTLAVVFVVVQILIAIPLAIARGPLIAAGRFTAMGANLLVEGGARVVLGAVAGLLWGLTGLAAALAVATGVALLAVPRQAQAGSVTIRRTTSLLHTWLTLVLLGVLVQLDVLVAPSVFDHSAAVRYDLAAVPSRGVYLLLVAVSTLIFPYVRVHASRRLVVGAAGATCALGLLATVLLVLLRHTVALVLGQDVASVPLLLALGTAMSIAGATGILLNGGIALGVARPWPPLLLGVVALVVCIPLGLDPLQFGVIVLSAQVATCAISAFVCLRRPGHLPAAVVPLSTIPEV